MQATKLHKIVFNRITKHELYLTEKELSKTERGVEGFGSTDV